MRHLKALMKDPVLVGMVVFGLSIVIGVVAAVSVYLAHDLSTGERELLLFAALAFAAANFAIFLAGLLDHRVRQILALLERMAAVIAPEVETTESTQMVDDQLPEGEGAGVGERMAAVIAPEVETTESTRMVADQLADGEGAGVGGD